MDKAAEDTANFTDLNPETLTSSLITRIKGSDINHVDGGGGEDEEKEKEKEKEDDSTLKTDTQVDIKEMCDEEHDADNDHDAADVPVSDNTTQLSIASPSLENSKSNQPNESTAVNLSTNIEKKDVLEASKELKRTAIEQGYVLDVNSLADNINQQQSSSLVNNNDSGEACEDAVVNKHRNSDALSVVIMNDELSAKNILGSHQSRISDRTADKSKHSIARKRKRVSDGDGNTHHHTLKVSTSHSTSRVNKDEKSISDTDLTYNVSESFGESHVNKLMSFVDSLEKVDPTVSKACGTASFSHLGSASQTKEFKNVTPVKNHHPRDDLFKPYTISPSNLASRNTSSMYNAKSAGLAEQPLDLSLTRNRSPVKEFLSKPPRGSPSFSKSVASDFSTDQMISKYRDVASTYGTGSSSHDLSSMVKRPWVPDSGTTSAGINWSLAASSLASLQAQMEAVILSYPLFKASIELCKNLIPPGDCETGRVVETSRLNIKKEMRDNQEEYASQFKTEIDKREGSPELRSHKDNLKDTNSKASLYSSSSTSKPSHSQHVSRRKQKLSLPSDRYSKASMDWRSNQGSLKGKSLTMQEDTIKKPRMEDCTVENPRMTGVDIGSDAIDDKRLLTSLSCSCQRQFATLYQLTIHLEETGHHPLQAKTDSADDFAKLVRGQDLWLSAGHAQAEQTLRCMHCHASFHSLPELTVHMVKTKHYVDIVGREESDASRQLITKEVLQKIQQTLSEQEEKGSKESHICKQCRMKFYSEDDLSEHLFETGHQMLSEEGIQANLRNDTPSGSQGDTKPAISDVRDNSYLIGSVTELNTQTESIVGAQIKSEDDSANCAGSSNDIDDHKLLSDRHVKSQFDLTINPENAGSKISLSTSNKRNDFSLNERSIINGKRKRESCIQQSSTSIYKRKPVTNKVHKASDVPQSQQDKAVKSRHDSTSPFRNVESRSWNESITNQCDTNKTNEDISRKGFMELISPLADVGDSSSTLKAMESFVERSFSSSNLISPVSHFLVSQAGKQSSLSVNNYSSAIRSATRSSTSRHPVGINWNDRSSTIPQNKVHLRHTKNPNISTDSSSDSCHSPPLKLVSKQEFEISLKTGQSDFQIKRAQKNIMKRKRNDSLSDFEARNSRLNSLSSLKTQPKDSQSIESTELTNNETSDTLCKTKVEGHDTHEAVSPTNVTSSYASSTLDYLQHFVDDRALQLIPPPQIATTKSLHDAGRKLSIKT